LTGIVDVDLAVDLEPIVDVGVGVGCFDRKIPTPEIDM
jgi:hypothetical protein